MSKPIKSKYANKTKRAWYFPDTREKICAKCGVKTSVENFFKHNQTQDGWHSWCKPCCKEANRKSLEKRYASFEGRVTTFINSCRKSAQKRGNEFELTRQDFLDMWEFQGGKCAYTFIDMTTQSNSPFSVSVERIDNSIGYTKENTILVCNVVNKMKSDFPGELFYAICKAVVEHLGDADGNLAVDFEK